MRVQNKRRLVRAAALNVLFTPIIVRTDARTKKWRARKMEFCLYNRRMSQIPEIASPKNKLVLERGKLLDAVAAFSRAELEQPLPGGWSVQDILAHVANSETLNVKFAKLMLASDKPVQFEAVAADYPDYTGPFELDRFNAYMTDKLRAQSLDQVLQTLKETRDATLTWMDILTLEQLERRGQHAVWGEQSVRAMLKILMLHDKMHTQDIIKRKSPNE
jgi:uncharacterized damage-inducible protein DinB